MTHKSMEISDVLQQDVFVIWAANTKVGSLVSRMSVPAIDVWFLLHEKHFYAFFWSGWLIEGMSFCRCVWLSTLQRGRRPDSVAGRVCLGVFMRHKGDVLTRKTTTVFPLCVYVVLLSLSVYYTPSASDKSLCQPLRECIKSCVWVHMSVYLYYYCIQWACNSWFPDLNKECRESSISLYSSRPTLSHCQHTHTKW